ncbi:MAG: hypothetical protein WA148_07460 [Actinomycetota bacterium]
MEQAVSKSRLWIILIGVALALLVVIGSFGIGVFVGTQKARFSYRWAEHYYKNFGGPGRQFFRDLRGRDFVDGHGVFGEIIKIEGNALVVKSKRGVEKSVVVSKDTTIRRGGETIKVKDLKVNDSIVVIGSPNEKGQIEAKLIRVFVGFWERIKEEESM